MEDYIKTLKQIKKNLESWNKLNLSLFGRIAKIKMPVPPRFLFLFQMILIILKKNFFGHLNKIIQKFIWQQKRLRIRLKILQETKERAGFELPEWEIYYQAAVLNWIRDWVKLRDQRIINLETHDLQIRICTFLIYDKAKVYRNYKQHGVRKALLWAWEQAKIKI